MKRNQLKFLLEWLGKENRKPLIIRGARQVGKSTLVRLFAAEQHLPLLEVNLERFPELASAFSAMDPRKLINQLEALPQMDSIVPSSLLFLDELQAIPEAIPALRYLHEEIKKIPIISAGSLLEFALRDHNFSMPVGRVQYLHMGPMTFCEFLEALEEYKLRKEIDTYEVGKEINAIAHKRLSELLRNYLFVGGMPEAVEIFAKTRKFTEVKEVHSSIIDTYREDFPKYCGSRNLSRIVHIFNFAAKNVGTKVKYAHFSREEQSSTIKTDIELLSMARVISKVTHSHCSGLPLQADVEEKIYKLLFLDIGLMNAVCGLKWDSLSHFDNLRLINEGAIAEQFIGQHLQYLIFPDVNRELNYWIRERKTSNAEVDFVVSFHGKIIPIEVKSGKGGSLRSLHQFMGEKKAPLAVRFYANSPAKERIETTIQKEKKNINVNYDLISLPLYLVEKLPDIVADK
ncbi:MAG: ATP-binding protein [Deltaproteobacteria bacterium]|nr:ATP-binding protein [Deltaproteobacteria bacterium]